VKVSVLMPVYKTDETFLREAIESVLNQTFRDFELLILDDCPEDDRERIVRSYDDARVIYARCERNLGIAGARNRLLDMAHGEYLAVFDHDDVCMPERLAKEVAYLDAHPECGVVSGWTRPTGGTPSKFPEDDHDIKVAMMNGISMWHPAAMVRKSVLDGQGLRYDPALTPVEDYMLWMQLIPHTRFHNLQEVLIGYRWHATNTSVVRNRELRNQDLRCKAWARVHFPELWAESEMRRETTRRIRLFGIPFLKVVTGGRETTVRLFDRIPVLRIDTRTRMGKR